MSARSTLEVHGQVSEMTRSLAQLNWQSHLRDSLTSLKTDILNLQSSELRLRRQTDCIRSEICAWSNELEQYQSQHILVDIVHLSDEHCIVNKPANVCIDGDDEITLEKLTLNTLRPSSHDAPSSIKLRLCHQLDRATSGILIYGLTRTSTAKVSHLFQNRNVIKIYYAIVYGHLAMDHFFLDFPLSATPNDRIREMIATDEHCGRAAITECTVEQRGYLQQLPVSLVRVHLHSGRRHQIRLHLSQIGHPIIGDPTYSEGIDALKKVAFDRMYLDSHRLVLNFAENDVLDVCTQSRYTFASLITSDIDINEKHELHSNDKGQDALFFPPLHSYDQYHHCMVVPFVILGDDSIHILIKKSHKLDLVNYRNNKPRSNVLKAMCWNFMCEARLESGHTDAAQTMAGKLLDQYTECARYLRCGSQFVPPDLRTTVHNDMEHHFTAAKNVKYLAHHLASNMRRSCAYHVTALCAPYVIYMVPFSPEMRQDDALNGNPDLHWCPLTEILDEVMCYSPLHLLSMNDIKLQMDPVLHLFLSSNDCIASLEWIRNETHLHLEMNAFTDYMDRYQLSSLSSSTSSLMHKKQTTKDDRPTKVLENLYVGSIKAAKNLTVLRELQITHIIDCTANCKQYLNRNKHAFTVLQIPINDSVHDDILQYMDECLQFIQSALSEEKSVFVHCWQGASRSVSIVTGYLMKYSAMNLDDALQHIQRVRGSFARPNTAFLCQLMKMEKDIYDRNSFVISPKQLVRLQRKLNAKKLQL